MFEILRNDYSLFIRKDGGKEIGELTLKEGEVYKYFDKLSEDQVMFLHAVPTIKKLLSDNTALSVVYDNEKMEFVASIKEKHTIGEYNDQVVWNTVKSSSGADFMDAVGKLNSMLEDTNENTNKRTR